MKTYFYLCIKRLFTTIGLLILILLFGVPQAGIPALAQESQTTAFVNVNVIPMDTERVLENQTVIVEDGRITAIGPVDEITIPDSTEIIDGQGGYLMPGLADMHMHLKNDKTYNDPEQLLFFLSQGTTTIRSLGTAPKAFPWRGQVERGELIGPTPYMMGPTLIGNYRNFLGLDTILTGWNIIRLLTPLLLGAVAYLAFKQLRSRRNAVVGGGVLLLIGLVLMLTKTPPFNILNPIFDQPSAFVAENSVGHIKTALADQQEWDVDGVKVYEGLTEE
ncbi:MAG: hypothetical protein GY801_30995, partial [bacterium]|nr:hypothetical protein [bacterium]